MFVNAVSLPARHNMLAQIQICMIVLQCTSPNFLPWRPEYCVLVPNWIKHFRKKKKMWLGEEAKTHLKRLVPRTTPGCQIQCMRRTRGYPLVLRTQFVRLNNSHSSQRDWSLPRSEESMIIRTTTSLDSLFFTTFSFAWPPCQRRQKKYINSGVLFSQDFYFHIYSLVFKLKGRLLI